MLCNVICLGIEYGCHVITMYLWCFELYSHSSNHNFNFCHYDECRHGNFSLRIVYACVQLEIFKSLQKLIINKTVRYLGYVFFSSNEDKTKISECIRHHLNIYNWVRKCSVFMYVFTYLFPHVCWNALFNFCIQKSLLFITVFIE